MKKKIEITRIDEVSEKVELLNKKIKEFNKEYSDSFKNLKTEDSKITLNYNNSAKVRARKVLSEVRELSFELRKDLQFKD
jgi:hypothetical protein